MGLDTEAEQGLFHVEQLFHDWQFPLNGKALARFVGCGVFSGVWICRLFTLFVPCYSEWGFGCVEGV